MPDTTHVSTGAPRDWAEAFGALPQERPDRDAWQDIARRLPGQRRSVRWPALLAVAATLALAIVVPMRLLERTPGDAPATRVATTVPSTHPTTATKPNAGSAQAGTTTPVSKAAPTDPLEQLYAQSAQLEGVLAMARDDRVATGAATEVAADLDAQLARIDAQLRQPDLSRDRQLALWRARVDTLGTLVGFEGTRRWLAVHGQHYDGALVRVD